jgi:hypothetical protein
VVQLRLEIVRDNGRLTPRAVKLRYLGNLPV